MGIEYYKEMLDRDGFIYYRRRGWNEEWVLTDNPEWDLSKYEYRSMYWSSECIS